MAGPPIEDRKIYLDRYTTSGGGWSVDLAALMVPSDATQPSAMAITAGNSAGHFTVASGVLSVSATGDSADLSAGTYTFTVQGTWSAFGSATNTATLTVVCPANSVYVDPDTGLDSNPGTKASPWLHAPDDPNATSNSLAARTPGSLTLCVHKSGKRIYGKLVQNSANLINASNCGWGVGLTTYCGAVAMGAGTTPSSAEVSNNPLYASMKKWTFGSALSPAQYLIDRGANSGDGALVQWAQFPAPGTDPFTDACDPSRNLTGGMAQVAASAVVSAGASSTFTLPAAAVTEFGSADLTGCLLGLWIAANFVGFYAVTGYNTSTKVATFNFTGTLQTDTGNPATGNTAYQIIGHPLSIKAAGQFAWSIDNKTRYALCADGSAVELMTRDNGLDLNGVTSGAVHGLQFEGYWGLTDFDGSGVVQNSGSTWGFEVLGNTMRWLVSLGGVGAAVRGGGGGTATDVLVQWNDVYDTIRSSGARFGSSANLRVLVESNTFNRLTSTVAYAGNADSCYFDYNTIKNCTGVHANGFTFYVVGGTVQNNKIRWNDSINSDRGYTVDSQPGLVIQDNLFEEGTQKDACRIYGSQSTLVDSGNIYVRRRNVVGAGEDALAAGGAGNLGTHSGNIIDGLTGGVDATFTGNMLTQHSYGENDISANVAPDSGNTYEPKLWDGTLSPRWKQFLGSKRVGRSTYIYGIAVITVTNLLNQNISSTITHGWVPLASDSTRPISISGLNAQFNIANDAVGTGATGWTSTPGTVANGKYINMRFDTTSTFAAVNTATLDLGDGNTFTWSVTTKQTAGYPLVLTDLGDYWKPTSSMVLGGAASKTCTFAAFLRIDSMGVVDHFFGHYAGSTNKAFQIEVMSTSKLRISAKNAAFADIFEVQTPSLSAYIGTGSLISLVITIDTAQSTAAAGVKVYVNGVSAGNATSSGGLWTQDALINWPLANNLFQLSNHVGLIGMVYFSTTWVDLTVADNVDRFTPLRSGTDGSNITGSTPVIFLVGTDASTGNNWMDTNGINRGSGAKMIKQGATSVTLDSGGAAAWPSYTYATALTGLTGPASPPLGVTRNYTVTVNGALLNPVTVNFSDGAGGTFTPSSVVVNPTTGAQDITVAYQPSSAGAKTLTASATGLTSATLGVAAQPALATAYTLTGPASANVGDTVTLTLTLNGSNPNGVSVAFALSGVTGVFSDNPDVISAGAQIATLTFTPSGAGTALITPTNSEGLTNPAALSITVAAAPSTGGPPNSRLSLRLGLGL